MAATRTFQEYQAEKREREWSERTKKQKEAMGNDERLKKATEWKRIGNDKFKAGNLLEAKDYYLEAIIFVEDMVNARRRERNELMMPLCCNAAQVHLKLDEFQFAVDVASKAVDIAEVPRNEVKPDMHAKAFFRRGTAQQRLGKLEEARGDLQAALKLQPNSEDIARELAVVRKCLAEEMKKATVAMGGFFQRDAEGREQKEAKKRLQETKQRLAEEKRRERLAKAEQRQQMQTAFDKLSKGSMLYEKREQEMEPVRKKEEEKRQTLDLEKNLTNILDEAKGLPKTEDLDKFVEKKYERCREQSNELDQKKKILDKQKKEQQWEDDDSWRVQRDNHRRQIHEERSAGERLQAPPAFWEAKEVARWCEQRLRDMLVCASCETEELEVGVAERALASAGSKDQAAQGLALKAIITDVTKLVGDASVVRLNPHKPPLHFFDYFVKLDWEVSVARKGERLYRSADELIGIAAHTSDLKAPASVADRSLCGGTFKLKEFCSEACGGSDDWQMVTKVKRQVDCSQEVLGLAAEVRDRLRQQVEGLLCQWLDEYKEHWQ